MVPPDEIPMRLERLIVNELLKDLMEIYRDGYRNMGLDKGLHDLASSVYVASFKGQGITLTRICQVSRVPRATAKRHLDRFIKRGTMRMDGKKYWVADDRLRKPVADFHRAVIKIHRACAALEIAANDHSEWLKKI